MGSIICIINNYDIDVLVESMRSLNDQVVVIRELLDDLQELTSCLAEDLGVVRGNDDLFDLLVLVQ